MVDTDEARRLVPAIHDRWRRQTPGAIARSEAWWDFLFLDREHRRKGGCPRFHTVHPDGFVAYRVQPQMQDGFPAGSVEVLDGLAPGTVYVTENSYLIKADIEKAGASHDH